jgi:hypothetical protein
MRKEFGARVLIDRDGEREKIPCGHIWRKESIASKRELVIFSH